MTRIVKGPNKKELIDAFALRQPITVTLANGKEQQLTIKMLEYAGSEDWFNFVVEITGDYGHYDSLTQKGQLESVNDSR